MPYNAETIVVGCGNTLFKDDGFGPIVVNILENILKVKIVMISILLLYPTLKTIFHQR